MMLVAPSPSRAVVAPSIFVILAPIMAVVLFGFLIIGLALPVLPLHVHQGLGLSTFVVGLITGSQFAASLISRLWSGHYADSHGAKRAVVAGLLGAVAAGLLYIASLSFIGTPAISATILLLGRALLGGAESFIITGAFGWALVQVDARHAGKVIAWVGTAMWAAFALGAPVGSALYASYGFVAIALATTLIPLATLLLVLPLRSVVPPTQIRPAFTRVIGAVWVPGIGMALSSVGFGAITSFIALRFVDQGWSPVWLAFSAFAGAFILARVVGGHLPDKLGGARVALASVLIEAAGQALIWLASGPAMALAGAMLRGIGWSLVYPSFGIEAVHRAPPESRGLAMGAYTAFLDLAIGLASPALGAVAGGAGLGTVFLVSTLVVFGAAFIAVRLMRPQPHS
jgi:MFS family permease